MSKHYATKTFFRQSPNCFLEKYFSSKNIALDRVDFVTLKEADAETIYAAWLKLPDEARSKAEKDFREIYAMADEVGSKAIRDEAIFHKEDLLEKFAELKGFHEHAFWTFLERPHYWQGALDFQRADHVPPSYWRKRKNLPKKPADLDPASILGFEQSLGRYLYTMQGRGKNCHVNCYRRGDLDYFFAYAEDFAQSGMEWNNGKLDRRAYHPVFEIMFVFSEKEGSLAIYLVGDRKVVPDLQNIFAEALLKTELIPDEKDERVYDLEPLKSRQFRFVYEPDWGIEKIVIKKLKLSIPGEKKEKIVLETAARYDKEAIFDLYDKATKEFPHRQILMIQVGIKVTFASSASYRGGNTRTFDVTWPNSCNLKYDGRDLLLRKMLVDSGIEPKEPVKEEAAA